MSSRDDPNPTPARAYGGFAEWLLSGQIPAEVLAHRSAGSVPVHLVRQRLREAYSDPATPDLTVALITAGGGRENRLDLGHGRFGFNAPPGEFVVFPHGVPTDIRGPGPYEHLTVSFPFAVVPPMLERAGLRPVEDLGRLHAGGWRDGTIERLCHELWREAGDRSPMGGLYADGLLTSLVARLLGMAERPVPAPRRRRGGLDRATLRRVLDHMHDRRGGAVSLDELAGVAYLSVFHFGRQFKRATGLSPARYMMRLRVGRARELIEDPASGLSLAQVAAACGFSDQAHLTRHFKAAFGVTPGAARETD